MLSPIIVVIILLTSQLDMLKCERPSQGRIGNQRCSEVRTGAVPAEAPLSTRRGEIALWSTKHLAQRLCKVSRIEESSPYSTCFLNKVVGSYRTV